MEARELLRASETLNWMAERYTADADREGAEKATLIRATQTLCIELAYEILRQGAEGKPPPHPAD